MASIIRKLEDFEIFRGTVEPESQSPDFPIMTLQESSEGGTEEIPTEVLRLYSAVRDNPEGDLSDIMNTYVTKADTAQRKNRNVSNNELLEAFRELSNRLHASQNRPSLVIPPPPGSSVTSWTPELMKGWEDLLKQMSAIKRSGSQPQKVPYEKPTGGGGRGGRGGRRSNNRGGAIRKNPTGNQGAPSASSAPQMRGKCLECGKEGHWKRSCPSKKVHFCDDHSYYYAYDSERNCMHCNYKGGGQEKDIHARLSSMYGCSDGSGKGCADV